MLLLFAGDNCGLFIFFPFFSSYHKENIENKDFEHLIAIHEEFDKILVSKKNYNGFMEYELITVTDDIIE